MTERKITIGTESDPLQEIPEQMRTWMKLKGNVATETHKNGVTIITPEHNDQENQNDQ